MRLTPEIRALLERVADLLDDVADAGHDCKARGAWQWGGVACTCFENPTLLADITRDVRDVLTRPT